MNEKDNHLLTVEFSEEQNGNMLDGILNNLPPSPLPKGSEKKELDRAKEPPAPVKELVSLQRRCANNLNQVAVHANTFGVYPEEIAGFQRDYEKLWGRVSDVLTELSVLVEK